MNMNKLKNNWVATRIFSVEVYILYPSI